MPKAENDSADIDRAPKCWKIYKKRKKERQMEK